MSWNSTEPMVSIRNVYKAFGDLEVLKGVSLDVMKGEVICIIGPSGSGKSTLIRCINALNDIQSGSILVEGQEVNDPKLDKLELRKKVGMVFQQYNLFPHKTALENVMMAPVRVLKQKKAKAEENARALIKKVRLEGKENAYPGELSGGQQQRVAIARALVNDPALILADEPTGALDSRTSLEIMVLLQQLNAAGMTIVMVTHEADIAAFASRIITFRDGEIISDTPHTPDNAAAKLDKAGEVIS